LHLPTPFHVSLVCWQAHYAAGSENRFQGPIRPDHAPTLVGEANDTPGYAMQGRVFAIGYMKGILDGLRLPNE
jgi:D-mannonate dehydratase